MSETKPAISFGAFPPTEDEFLKEIDEWHQADLAIDFIEYYYHEYNKLPQLHQVIEHYEHRYMNDIIVKKELERFESMLTLQKTKK
jgi:hypothetical protein